jgi:hypothetical protein
MLSPSTRVDSVLHTPPAMTGGRVTAPVGSNGTQRVIGALP